VAPFLAHPVDGRNEVLIFIYNIKLHPKVYRTNRSVKSDLLNNRCNFLVTVTDLSQLEQHHIFCMPMGRSLNKKTASLPFASHMLVSIHMTYQLIPSAHQISRYNNNNNNNNNTHLTAPYWDYPGEPVRER